MRECDLYLLAGLRATSDGGELTVSAIREFSVFSRGAECTATSKLETSWKTFQAEEQRGMLESNFP